MDFVPRELNRECSRCKGTLTPTDLVCSSCHALVHVTALEQLAANARLQEEHGEIIAARDNWVKALELLPPESTQSEWIRGNVERLNGLAVRPPAASARHAWAKKLGPFAPVVILLANSKFLLALFKLKFLFSLGTFIAFYWALYGMKFGVGFALLILVHEMGHFIAIKRRGLPADMPVFLPGFGAYVRWAALGVSTQTRSFVSLAGPMAGCLGSAVCALVWMQTGETLWIGLAAASALLNVVNLIPLWVLDGGQAITALNKTDRIVLSAAAVLFAVCFSQPVFLLVAAGAAYRVFTKDEPEHSNLYATVYYLAILSVLGFLIQLAPRH
jgi:Zn-dependent protease